MTKGRRRLVEAKEYESGASGAVYDLGFIGAAVYYIQHASTCGAGVLGFLRALVWPALLIYRALTLLKM